jgi:hypothetical protein
MTSSVWYNKLVPEPHKDQRGKGALLEKEQAGGFVVAREAGAGAGAGRKQWRQFARFASPDEFYRYQTGVPDQERCFYELIFGSRPQRFYLDLDLERDKAAGACFEGLAAELFEATIAALLEVYAGLGAALEPRDCLVYQSHGPDKFSFHILPGGYYLGSNVEAKAVFDLVRARVPEHLRDFVDTTVYKPHQELRLLGSHKLGSSRVKRRVPAFFFRGAEVRGADYGGDALDEFRDSLVGTTLGTRRLDVGERAAPAALNPAAAALSDAIPPEVVGAVMNLMAEATKEESLPFVLKGQSAPFILLQRVRPSRCRLCERVHEHENPYLFVPPPKVTEELVREGKLRHEAHSILYTCRRCEPPRFLLMGEVVLSRPVPRAAARAALPAGSETSRAAEGTNGAEESGSDTAAATETATEAAEVATETATEAAEATPRVERRPCCPPRVQGDDVASGEEAWLCAKLARYQLDGFKNPNGRPLESHNKKAAKLAARRQPERPHQARKVRDLTKVAVKGPVHFSTGRIFAEDS